MQTLDLNELTRGETDVLLGYDYGRRAREHFGLDALDAAGRKVVVLLPAGLDTIAPSFGQGFFGESALRLGRERFYDIYDFSDWPEDLRLQVDTGIERALMDRRAVLAA